MAPRRRDIYRSKGRRRFPITWVLVVLALLIAGAVLLFTSLQKYAVYGRDGVTLAIPGLAEPPEREDGADQSPLPTQGPRPVHEVQAELVIKPPDYSAVDLHPGEGLLPIRGKYITNAQLLSGAAGGLGITSEADAALVLEMVTPEGILSWASKSQTAMDYGVNGQAELTELVNALKDKGYYLIAEINCCRGTLLAKRSPSMALKNAGGNPYTDERGGWLDPYSLALRDYLLSLGEELCAAGFDELLLSGLSFPENQAAVSFAQERSGTGTPRTAVSGLAVHLARNLPEEAVVSVLLENSAFEGMKDPEKEAPQDLSLFCRVFDRLYYPTDPGYYASDSAALAAHTGELPGERVVPITDSDPGCACYMLRFGS